MPLLLAVICLALLLIYPQDRLAAARDACLLWQQTVAPSLIPFFALIPALTCPEAAACFSRIMRLPCRMLGVQEAFAGAVGIAFAAGSPAGTKALMRIAAGSTQPSGALFRSVMLCAGGSPGFLVSGVGAGMLGAPSAGMILLLSQLLALIAAAGLLRLAVPDDAPVVIPHSAGAEASPVLFAVNGVLAILIWMVTFAVGARLIAILLPAAAPFLPFAAEFSAGCAHAVKMRLPLWGVAAVVGFGGVCAGCQNLSVVRSAGISPAMYFAGKAIHASLCALFARLLCDVRLPQISFAPQHVLLWLLAACLLPRFHKIVTPAPK